LPTFYFHVRDDLDTPDHEGVELPDLETAVARARDGARALMCETMSIRGRIVLHHAIDVEDSTGEVLAKVRFADAVRIEE
jgi:hypothetical protein